MQLCRALGYAHAAGVIHRDLKPQNVMLTFTGVAKLIDFGIATRLQERALPGGDGDDSGLTRDDGVVGTHGYISPERLYGGPATVSSDLFALGVVLYQLLTGRSPSRR